VSSASDERIADPQEELEPAARDRVEVLEHAERDEEPAEADFDEQVPAYAAGHFELLMQALGAVFRDDELELAGQGEISADERVAIEALQEVVRGRDHREDRILYAEERLDMLNQVLAVLQPTLAMALTPELAELRDEYDAVVEEVSALRDRLENLDSAQEEIFEQDRDEAVEAPDTDDDDDTPDDAKPDKAEKADKEDKKGLLDYFRKKKDKPAAAKPADEPTDPDAPKKSSLYGEPGEPAVEKPATKSTLGDE
jgi:hypothetical protein